MAIKLKQGDGIRLSQDHGVRRARLETSWDLDPSHPVKKHEMEVKAAAFELTHASGKALAPADESFVFYNNDTSATGAVTHEKGSGINGSDRITIDLDALAVNTMGVDEVSCIAEIYEGLKRGHHFGQFQHCTAHIINVDTDEVIAEFSLTDNFGNATAIQLGSFALVDGHLTFKAVGVGYQKGLADFLAVYGLQAEDEE